MDKDQEIARLKAEVERWKTDRDNQYLNLSGCRIARQELEARLAEATRLLKATMDSDGGDLYGYAHGGNSADCELFTIVPEIIHFLKSPTNSEAQERQRAKDKVVDVARKLDQYKITSFMESGYSTKEWDDLQNALKALDSLPSEARGGCEHDKNGFWSDNVYPCAVIPKRVDYPTCPFCDKKTGGV